MTDEEKMQKMQEIMDSFLNKVAERAYHQGNASSESTDSEFGTTYGDMDSDFSTFCENTNSESSTFHENTNSEFSTFHENTDSEATSSDFNSDSEFSRDDKTPKSNEPIRNSGASSSFNPDDWKKAMYESMKMMKSFYDSENCNKKAESERRSSSMPKQCSDNIFKKNTATFNGNPFEYRVCQREVNWGAAFSEANTVEDNVKNLDKLNEFIIQDIKKVFGDLSRIKEIAVISGMLIINGVQYYPLCKDKAFLDSLPFDCIDYFKCGMIAEVFDFGYLCQMPCLTILKIDSMDFVIKKFSYDIGLTGEFKVPKVFKMFKNLKFFEIGDNCFKSPGKDVNAEVEESIAWHEKFASNYHNYIIANGDSFTGWTFNNLKTYACNKGNKGFLRYSGGILARTGMFLTVGAGNLTLKTVGLAFKGGAKLLKNAFSDDV